MILKIFSQPNCPNCPPAKKLGQELEKEKPKNLIIEWYDVSGVDGMAEGAFYSIQSTPSVILTDDDGQEVAGWRGESPEKKEVLKKVK